MQKGIRWLGNYGYYAVPAAAITGAMAYDSASKSNQSAVIDRAINQRARRSYFARPSEILATPSPVPMNDSDWATLQNKKKEDGVDDESMAAA
jgi:hypothetical protein